jgi:hypothetical protein
MIVRPISAPGLHRKSRKKKKKERKKNRDSRITPLIIENLHFPKPYNILISEQCVKDMQPCVERIQQLHSKIVFTN